MMRRARGYGCGDKRCGLAASSAVAGLGDRCRRHGNLKTSAPDLRQSILQDADRGRRLELDETLDHTLTLATRLGVPSPTLALCCRVLRMVSRSARGPDDLAQR